MSYNKFKKNSLPLIIVQLVFGINCQQPKVKSNISPIEGIPEYPNKIPLRINTNKPIHITLGSGYYGFNTIILINGNEVYNGVPKSVNTLQMALEIVQYNLPNKFDVLFIIPQKEQYYKFSINTEYGRYICFTMNDLKLVVSQQPIPYKWI